MRMAVRPRRIERFQEMLDIIERESEGRPEAQIAYATVVSGINNGLKNNQGMLAGTCCIEHRRRQGARRLPMPDFCLT